MKDIDLVKLKEWASAEYSTENPGKWLLSLKEVKYLSSSILTLIERLEAVERERDELEKVVDVCKKESARHREARQKAEAEIARRDAAAGEPVAWRYRFTGKPGSGPFTSEWKIVSTEDECNPTDCFERQALYTAAQPAVLPPEKVVKLPEAYAVKSEHGDLAYYPGDDGDSLDKSEVIAALDAAGVKWEVSK